MLLLATYCSPFSSAPPVAALSQYRAMYSSNDTSAEIAFVFQTSYTSIQRAAKAVIDIRFRDRPDISLPPVIDQPFFNGTRISIRAGLIISAPDRFDRGDYICTIVTDHGNGTTTVVLSEGELYMRFAARAWPPQNLSCHATAVRKV